MNISEPVRFENEKFRFNLGSYEINTLFINFMPPDPGWVEYNHCHSTYELHIIPCGSGQLEAEEQCYGISGGDIYLTGPGVYHRQKTNPGNPMMEYCINFEITGPKALRHRETAQTRELDRMCSIIRSTPFWFGRDMYGCTELMERLYTELSEKGFAYRKCAEGLLIGVLVCFVRSLGELARGSETGTKTAYERRSHILDTYFYYKYSEPVNIDKIAKSLFVSRRQLFRIIEKKYGMTFTEKLNSIRIKNAKILLEETDISVAETAERVGYSSSAYFIRTFREYEGITPLKYRSMHRKKGFFDGDALEKEHNCR